MSELVRQLNERLAEKDAEIERLRRTAWVHEATLIRLRAEMGDDFVNNTLIAAHALVNQIHPAAPTEEAATE